MLSPETVLEEHEDYFDGRPARIQRLREEIREYTGLEVPRGKAGVMPWYRKYQGTITRKLREETGYYEDEDGDAETG